MCIYSENYADDLESHRGLGSKEDRAAFQQKVTRRELRKQYLRDARETNAIEIIVVEAANEEQPSISQ